MTKLTAIAHQKCPRCREGKIFKHKTYDLGHYQEMYSDCPVCGLHYELEPGFFWAAMYVSYMLNVALGVTFGVATYVLLNDPGPLVYSAIVIGAVFLLMPFIIRMSKVMLLHLFSPIRYNPSYSKRNLN